MIERIIKSSIEVKEGLLKDTEIHKTILSVVEVICNTFNRGKIGRAHV